MPIPAIKAGNFGFSHLGNLCVDVLPVCILWYLIWTCSIQCYNNNYEIVELYLKNPVQNYFSLCWQTFNERFFFYKLICTYVIYTHRVFCCCKHVVISIIYFRNIPKNNPEVPHPLGSLFVLFWNSKEKGKNVRIIFGYVGITCVYGCCYQW